MIQPTLKLQQAAAQCWDVLVVGAGPAGTFAAHELSRRGLHVLLIDKARFPRQKVCGCCLNEAVFDCLQRAGLRSLLANYNAATVTRLELRNRTSVASVPLTLKVLSRDVFDAALVAEAVNQGAHFLPETTGLLGPSLSSHREVHLRRIDGRATARARLVLAADGLMGRFSASRHRMQSQQTAHGLLGVQTIQSPASSVYSASTLYMACGDGGYVGLVRLEDQRLNIAAALDSRYLRRVGSVSRAVTGIMEATGLPGIETLQEQRWQGTPPLTHQSMHLARNRLFVLGDAAGFVQPFTGEGIAWALSSAEVVIPLAIRGVTTWDSGLASEWGNIYRRTIIRKQVSCRALSTILKHPTLASLIIGILGRTPGVAPIVMRWLGLAGPQACNADPIEAAQRNVIEPLGRRSFA
jgi:flavin-dependent dehydrogenase